MKKLLFLFVLIVLTTSSFSQTNTSIIRQKTIGGDNSDFFQKALQASDGGYLIALSSRSGISGEKTEALKGSTDIWLVKIDNSFSIQWQKTIGGNSNDFPADIIASSDGGYFILAYSDSEISGDKTVNNHGIIDYWLLKIDSVGNILWQKTYGGSLINFAKSIIKLPGSRLAILGTSNSDSSGVKTENSKGLYDIWLVVVDSAGSIIFDKTIGGDATENVSEAFYCIQNNEVIISAITDSDIGGDISSASYGSDDYWMFILNPSNGQIRSSYRYGGNSTDLLRSFLRLDNHYYFTGSSSSDISGVKTENNRSTASYHADIWVIKTDTNGTIIWDKTIGGNYNDLASQSVISFDNQIILVSSSNSDISGEKIEARIGNDYDFWIVSIDTEANILWQKAIGGTAYDFFRQCIPLGINHYILFGDSKSGVSGYKTEACRGQEDLWIVEISNNLGLENFSQQALNVYPNPTNDYFTFEMPLEKSSGLLHIFSSDGRIVHSLSINNQNNNISIKHLPSGTYFVSYFDEKGNSYSAKLIKE